MISTVGSPAEALAIPLEYEIKINFAETHPAGIEGKEILAAVWAQFWENVVGDICRPLGDEYANPDRVLPHPHVADQQGGGIYDHPMANQPLAYAFPLHPRYLREANFSNSTNFRDYWAYRDGARPPTAFARRLTADPKVFRGQWFAAGIGYTWNGEGEWEQRIVLTVELGSFIAKEGSLWARGVVIATFIGGSVILPLFLNALGTSIAPDVTETRSKIVISNRLSKQSVQCDVTGGFTFSRADLAAKFEHRLKLQGAAGICETQSALAALGYSPGLIDGKAGPNYHSAAKTFALAWGLSEKDLHTPVFFNMLARALTGERPPGK